MALFVLQPGVQPLGQFDLLDVDQASVLGGEVGVFDYASRTNTSTEKAAKDARDGYLLPFQSENSPTSFRPVIRLANHGTSDGYKMFYLMDEGTTHYGTLFGQVVGTPVGLTTTGTNLGPHTASGSGKVTLWSNPGLYAVSLDAVYAGDAGVPQSQLSSGLDTPLPGELLFRHSTTGELARYAATGVTKSDVNGNKVAVFIEMSTSRSLVNTPSYLVGATTTYDRIVISYLGAGASIGATGSV